MLNKKFRIATRSRLEYILKKGRILRGNLFRYRFLPGRLKHSRFAVIVSKQVSRKAVERNTIKRRTYEALRRNWNLLGESCYDIVVLVRKSDRLTYDIIEKELFVSLKKIL